MTDRKRPIDHVLDLMVFAPLGFVLNIEEVLPQLIERGHQQVTMARMFGQFAVDTGTKEVRKRVEQIADRGNGPAPAPALTSDAARTVAAAVVPDAAAAVVDEPGEAPPSSAELAITDYDSLAASQVVPRLEGLAPEELDAVRRYEAAHRGRKTILSKIAQLG